MKNEGRTTISERVIAIKVVYSDKEANAFLEEGWRMFGMPIWSEALTTPVFFLVFLHNKEDQN